MSEADDLIYLCEVGVGSSAEAIKLIESGARIDYADLVGITAAHYAAFRGMTDVIKAFCERPDWDPTVKASNGMTPLDAAWAQGRGEVIDVLEAHMQSLGIDTARPKASGPRLKPPRLP